MKTSILALAASALLTGTEAATLHRRHAHQNAHLKRDYAAPAADTCKVVTYTTWVEYTAPPKPATHYTQTTVTVVPEVKSTTCALTTVPYTYTHPVPTPEVTTCPTPGTYTIPAKTVTLTDTHTVCVPTTTILTPGTHTYGHTTTVIATDTVITCPYATKVTSASTVYTTVTDTVITCPSAGTYTFGGYTTTVTKTETAEYPVITTYTPGTYAHPASTIVVTETGTIYTCPYEAVPTSTYVAPKSTYVAPVTTKQYVAPPVTTKTYVAPVSSAPATYASPSPKPKPTTYSTTGGQGSYGNVAGANGKQWALTYTQYNNDRSCKTRDQIFQDICDIKDKGFRSIRVYAPDCDALEHISDACEKYGLTIILGIFVRGGDQSTGYTDVYKQIDQICSWGKWNLIELIVIGNESVFGGVISSSDLAGLIAGCRTKLVGAGYTGKITTSEVVAIIQKYPGLCEVIDVVGVNIQPFFNGGYASDAGDFLQGQLKIASDICGKPAYCLEAGWPSGGSPLGNAVPGQDEQKQAIYSIHNCDEGHIVYHSQYDDQWKDPSMNGGVEQHFGCSHLFPISGGY